MALSDSDTARLASLRTAYDSLISGANTARVTTAAGKTVEFGQGDVAALKREIDQLAGQAASTSGRTRGALRFMVR